MDNGPKIGNKIIFLSQCSSTNDLAKESAQMGESHGTIYSCNSQTAGRGKEGKSWFSLPGKGIYFSVILRPQKNIPLSWLPYIPGISVCESVRELFNVSPAIKWPNDVYLEEKKFCGILIESSFGSEGFDYAIVGIGINVNHEKDDFPEDLKERATSIKIVVGKEVDNDLLFENIIKKLNFWYEKLALNQISIIHRTLNSLSFIPIGSRIEILDGERIIRGELRGFDTQGALLLRERKRIHKIYSGEMISYST